VVVAKVCELPGMMMSAGMVIADTLCQMADNGHTNMYTANTWIPYLTLLLLRILALYLDVVERVWAIFTLFWFRTTCTVLDMCQVLPLVFKTSTVD